VCAISIIPTLENSSGKMPWVLQQLNLKERKELCIKTDLNSLKVPRSRKTRKAQVSQIGGD
jgi:hypothetical protein